MRWRRFAVKLDCVPDCRTTINALAASQGISEDMPLAALRGATMTASPHALFDSLWLKSIPAWLTASLCALIVFLLAGCASTSVLPAKSQAQGQSQTTARLQSYKLTAVSSTGQTEDTLLIVQPEAGGATRWIQTNALGAPLARLQLSDGAWRTDGFLPPNPAAQQLFEAIIASQIPRQQWASAYPDIDIASAQRDGKPVHTFSRQGHTLWTLQLPDENKGQSSAEHERKFAEPRAAAATASSRNTDTAPVTHIELPDQRRWQLMPLSDSAAPSAQNSANTSAKSPAKPSSMASTTSAGTSQTPSEAHQRRIPRLHPLEPQQYHDKKLPE